MQPDSTRRRFPVTIRRGSVVTRIYRIKRGDGREVFAAAWNAGGVRRTRQFPTYMEAHAEASLKADQLATGKVNAAIDFSGDDAAALVEARAVCAGTPLLSALREWARARDLTGGNVIQAAEFWKARNVANITRKKVSDVLAEFLRAKTKAGFNVANDHASTFERIRVDLGDEFIGSVSAAKLATWLAKRENTTSRNTARKRVVALWRWAQKQGYLPRDTKTEAEQTERAREVAPPIGIISAATFEKYLGLIRGKRPDLLAAVVVGGFCGLRTKEVDGQTWEDINLSQKFLRVTVGKRGTPARRLIPLSDAAIEWLMICEGEHKGPICPPLAIDFTRRAARDATPPLSLPKNCLRHSFISHRIAATGNIPETSIAAGNSVTICHRHYRELVTNAEGVAWFDLRPSTAGDVLDMAGKAVRHA